MQLEIVASVRIIRISLFQRRINFVNYFQIDRSYSAFLQFHYLFFPTPLQPAEFQASGNKSDLANTI